MITVIIMREVTR